jgi:hypothetical protein
MILDENEGEFLPKEDVNLFLRFDSNEFKKDPNACVSFQITDNDGNPLHDSLNLSKLSNESLLILVNSVVTLLDNVIEPEIEKRNEKDFMFEVDKEISSLIDECGMKDDN